MNLQELKTFEGRSQSPEDWLFHLELVSDANEWTSDQKLKKAFVSLSGEALTWYKNIYLTNGHFTNYDVFKKAFLERFRPLRHEEFAIRSVMNARQNETENVMTYSARFQVLLKQAECINEKIGIIYFIEGLKSEL